MQGATESPTSICATAGKRSGTCHARYKSYASEAGAPATACHHANVQPSCNPHQRAILMPHPHSNPTLPSPAQACDQAAPPAAGCLPHGPPCWKEAPAAGQGTHTHTQGRLLDLHCNQHSDLQQLPRKLMFPICILMQSTNAVIVPNIARIC
jgi:hypothetical protein